ncbi:NAD-dependent epimerase/dehydratase family protein [Saccharopolyspora rhizosphaerae]|uniref:NAD-dependent epimerase/dehydratase family protein n=1 Tax=Saccharopolyspora rhizosphaerae TaxID=2492662 RepID=A0A3R8Q5C1_9PSEU|nr:NAD-dependent epimerase/dehydratase family protein [Saccharopolyspora rhizosphaerae]RRO18921.1 NAD-dependent epimerase/dehydratase family protein [Saccharopolyspora rhizosphaerae]
MRALVTGGAGFIGSHLVDQLVGHGHRVCVVDDFSRGSPDNLIASLDTGRVALHRVDVCSPELVALTHHHRPEVVFHLAAQIDVRASVDDPLTDARANVLGAVNVAEAVRLSGARKVVYATSGGSIYGHADVVPTDESAPARPFSPYAASKLAGEIYFNSYSRLHGLDCTHLAMSNVYGPRQLSRGEAGVVSVFATAMLDRARTVIYGDGCNTRDYVHVDDVVAAFLAAAGEPGSGQRYNVSTGVPTSDRELHTIVAAAAGAPDTPTFMPARKGDVRRSVLDRTRIGTELGWKPQIDLVTGVGDLVRHLRSRRSAPVA